MKNNKDKQIVKTITELQNMCTNWLQYVKDLGNQCAYTDRGVESILELASKLDKIYNKNTSKKDVDDAIDNELPEMPWDYGKHFE